LGDCEENCTLQAARCKLQAIQNTKPVFLVLRVACSVKRYAALSTGVQECDATGDAMKYNSRVQSSFQKTIRPLYQKDIPRRLVIKGMLE
jgi:hypothetical protein